MKLGVYEAVEDFSVDLFWSETLLAVEVTHSLLPHWGLLTDCLAVCAVNFPVLPTADCFMFPSPQPVFKCHYGSEGIELESAGGNIQVEQFSPGESLCSQVRNRKGITRVKTWSGLNHDTGSLNRSLRKTTINETRQRRWGKSGEDICLQCLSENLVDTWIYRSWADWFDAHSMYQKLIILNCTFWFAIDARVNDTPSPTWSFIHLDHTSEGIQP